MRFCPPYESVAATTEQDVDGRDKPGHDGNSRYVPTGAARISAQYTLYFEFGV